MTHRITVMFEMITEFKLNNFFISFSLKKYKIKTVNVWQEQEILTIMKYTYNSKVFPGSEIQDDFIPICFRRKTFLSGLIFTQE